MNHGLFENVYTMYIQNENVYTKWRLFIKNVYTKRKCIYKNRSKTAKIGYFWAKPFGEPKPYLYS